MAEPHIEIRAATAADVRTLVDFNVAMARESEDKGLDPERLTRGVGELLRHPAEGFYLIVSVDDVPAGSLMVTFEWSDWRAGRFWWIQSVYVAPEYRRQGLYSRLHRAVRELAEVDPAGCGIRLYVERDNAGARRTYEELGMVETAYRLYEEEFTA